MANTIISKVVLGNAVGASIPSKLKFTGVAKVSDRLEKQTGDTIKVDKYAYIGKAEDVAKGAAIPISDISMTTQSVTVKKAGKGFTIHDEDLVARGDELLVEMKGQLVKSIADQINSQIYEAAKTATQTYDAKTAILDYAAIVNAVALFGDEDVEPMALFINPLQRAQLLLDDNFIKASELGDKILSTGVIGEIAGCQVIVSSDVKKRATFYDNVIVKQDGVGLEIAKKAIIGEDRDNEHGLSKYFATSFYAAYLRDVTKVVKLITLAQEA